MEEYLSTIVRANRAIQDAARGKVDVACAKALPKDLGDWRPAVEFALGPYGCGKSLDDVSAMDFAHSLERDVDAFCRQGFGALLAKLGTELPVQLETPVTRVAAGRSGMEVTTSAASSLRAPSSSRLRPPCSPPARSSSRPTSSASSMPPQS